MYGVHFDYPHTCPEIDKQIEALVKEMKEMENDIR